MAGMEEKVLRALARYPYIYLVDSRAGGDAASVEAVITRAGLWGIVEKARLTPSITAYYVDLSRLERYCLYDECSARDRGEQESCVGACVERKLRGLAALAGEGGV